MLTQSLVLLCCVINALPAISQTEVSPTDKPCNAPTIVASGTPGICIDYNFPLCCADTSYHNFLGKDPACGSSPTGRDVWFKISNMNVGEEYNFMYTEKGHRQTWVEIYELPAGSDCKVPANYSAVSCSRENDVNYFPQSTATATFVPKNATSTYYVRLMRASLVTDGAMAGNICIVKSYVNDLPCGAIYLPIESAKGTNPVQGQNYAAATWTPTLFNNILCGPNNDVWYKFVPEECSVNIFLKNLNPTSYEIQAAILESVDGTCNNLKQVTACGGIKDKFDDILLSVDGLTVGKTYYVIVDGFAPPYYNATGKHTIEVFKKPNAPLCPNIKTPCDCSSPSACSNPVPLPNSSLGNLALDKAKNDGSVNGCFDLKAQNIPLVGGTNRAEFCANYTAAPGDDFMAFDNVVYKDASCSILTNLSKNVVYESGDCNKPIPPTCVDVNGKSPVYRLTPGKTYKFCRQSVADGGDIDCVGKNYQSFCAFLWKINNKSTLNQTICNGGSFAFNGTNYDKSGSYTVTFPNAVTGCDSIVTLNLTVLPKLESVITPAPVCAEKGYVVGNITYTVSGTYKTTIKSSIGCDSTVTLNLTVLAKKESSITRTVCDKQTVTIGTTVFSLSGTYVEKIKAANGCDSTVTLNLTVLAPIGKKDKQIICFGSKYTYKGKDYDKSGDYDLEIFKAKNGCDSILSLNLTVLPDYSNMKDAKTICANQTYVFGDKTLTTAGTYTHTFKSKYAGANCDSTVTLTLKLENRIETNLKKAICFGESLTVGGVVYPTSTSKEITLKANGGCDSIIKLDLTVRPEAKTTEQKVEICDGKSITVAGQTFTKEGVFSIKQKYPEGCDSAIIKLTVVVIRPETKSVNGFLCKDGKFEYNGKVYTKLGSYSDTTYAAGSGCIKEIVTINISNKNLEASISATPESCNGKCDGAAKIIGLTNAALPATYLWENGSTAEEIKSLCVGTYKVTITDKDGCTVIKTAVITTDPTPPFSIVGASKKASCDKASNGSASVTSPTGAGYTYLWNTGATTAGIQNVKPGNYSVTVTDKDGCKNTSSIAVEAEPNPVMITIAEGKNKIEIIKGQTKDITIVTTPPTGVTLSINPTTGTNINGNVIKFNPAVTTPYTIMGTDANGCMATANILVEVKEILFPSIFTPSSNDGNAIFQPTNFPEDAVITKFVIFDRWGNLVYDYDKAGKSWWNGKFQNKDNQELASDVYVYYVEYQVDGKSVAPIKNDITLIR